MSKSLPKFIVPLPILSIFFFITFIALDIYIISHFTNIANAQLSGCANIDIGNGGNGSPPPQCSTSSGALKNPFPDGWITGRLDMGYDGTFKKEIVAPFSGTITYVCSGGCGWGGGYITIKADQKPSDLPMSTLYFAEGLAPTVHTNQHVNAGDKIATPAYNGFGCGVGCIEWGVEKDGTPDPTFDTYARYLNVLAHVSGQCPGWSPAARSMVHSFYAWAKQNFHVAPWVITYSLGVDCAGSA